MGQKEPPIKVEKRFNAKVDQPDNFLQANSINGFEFSNVPVILNTTPEIITTNHHWGLVPSWSKDIDFRKNTLNAPAMRSLLTSHQLVSYSTVTFTEKSKDRLWHEDNNFPKDGWRNSRI